MVSCECHSAQSIRYSKVSFLFRNFKSCVSVVTDCSFGHLMTSARNGETPTLKRCLVNDHGIPVLSLSTGKTFSYCVDLNTW